MAPHIEKMTAEELVAALYDEAVDVNDISLEKITQRESFLSALEQRPALIAKINDKNAQDLLNFAIENNYEYFVYLKPEQYSNKLAQTFIYNRLCCDEDEKSGKKDDGLIFNVGKSLDNSVVFNCTYTTPDGEELFFRDGDLGVPVALKSSYKLTLKLTDAVTLIKKLDTHITMLGKKKIEASIEDVVSNLYKSHLNSYIQEKSKGFYALTTSYQEIEESFLPNINEVMSEYGLSISSFVIKAIAIPRDIQFKIEDQAFEIRRRLADAEADSELSKKSLEDYEAKLAIQHKYSDVPMTLTEYEKDLALRRYMIRTGKNKREEIDRNIEIAEIKETVDETIDTKKDVAPEITMSNFKSKFFTFLVCTIIFDIIMFAVSAVAGAVFLILTAVIFGLTALMCLDKFFKPTPEIPSEAPSINESQNTDDNN